MAGRNGRLDSRSQEVRKALKTLSEKGTGGTERGREGRGKEPRREGGEVIREVISLRCMSKVIIVFIPE